MAARHAGTLLLHEVERRFYFIFFTNIGDFKVLVAGCERILPRVSTSPRRLSSVASVCFSGLLALIHFNPPPKVSLSKNPCWVSRALAALLKSTPTALSICLNSYRTEIFTTIHQVGYICLALSVSFFFFLSFLPSSPFTSYLMRRHILLLPDIADGGFECVSLRLIIPHDRIQMQMDTEAGGQKKRVRADRSRFKNELLQLVCSQEDGKN